jgi:hypothetical protein
VRLPDPVRDERRHLPKGLPTARHACRCATTAVSYCSHFVFIHSVHTPTRADMSVRATCYARTCHVSRSVRYAGRVPSVVQPALPRVLPCTGTRRQTRCACRRSIHDPPRSCTPTTCSRLRAA